MVRKPLHDEKASWKAKSRICCCGNFEEGSFGGDAENRSEVPATYEMRTLLAMFKSKKDWGIGALDIKTAFLHAPLDDEDDGIVLVRPPTMLERLGLVPEELTGS